jgi:streptogramin lyase
LFAENALWVTCPKESKVFRVDPNTNVVVNRIEVPAQPVSLAFGETSVWVLCKTDGKVVRIDPKTNKTGATVELKTPGLPGEIAFGEGFLWASSPGFPMMRIDPGTDKVVQQFVGEGGGQLSFAGGSVWAFNLKANTLSRFDPKRIKATLAE